MRDLDFDADWRVFDGGRDVRYHPFDVATETTSPGPRCTGLRLQQTKEEIPTPDGGLLYVTKRTWHLRAGELGGVPVTLRGQIVEADGTAWVVRAAQLQTDGTCWRCETHKA